MRAAALAFLMWFVAPAIGAAESDYLFPEGGHAALGLASGIPYVGLAEVTYGFSDRFALGAIGGATPRVWGAGLRPRLVLWESAPVRVFAVMPSFYYPVTNGPANEPWVLFYPSARVELQASQSVRLHTGMGIVAAACVNELFGRDEDQHAHHEALEAGEPMFGAWNTLLVGGAWQLGAHYHVHAELALVLEGVRVAPETWIGGPPPLVAQLGMSFTL